MDYIMVIDDENEDSKMVGNVVQNESSNSNYNDELIAIQLEINEINKETNRLRRRRCQLLDRQKEVKEIIKGNQQSITKTVDQWKQTNFYWSSKVNEILTSVFKINSFRHLQLETINATLSNQDCILIMPTGGGKSLCYQLPAIISDGITIVVSPLLSLVEDQIYALRNLNIDARALNASTPRKEQTEIMHILDGKNKDNSTLKLLYLTPEKIAKSKMVMSKLQKLYESKRFTRLVIDEVHCISQFGHDFRPDYKFLSVFKRQFPNVSILGLTATATIKVMNDIRQILHIPRCILFRAPFNRKNLFYEVVHKSDVGKDALNTLVHCIQHRFDQQSGIVYCLSQKDAEDVCCELQRNNIKAGCYHAGLSGQSRTEVHEKWLQNQVHVICATIAFGMGIDKPDVRFVIHHSMSKSIENFYQESGRAGRDDQLSHCILFFRFGDVFRLAPMAFSDKSGNGLTNLYSMISYCLNESQCRRKLLAKYFDDVWQVNDCNQMCDICRKSSMNHINKRNCREEAMMIINYLKANNKQRLTALKLFEQISITTMKKLDIQRLILQLIIDKYLKEDFHFTPYNTICYIKLGPRAESVNSAHCQITLDIIENSRKFTMTDKSIVSTLAESSSKENKISNNNITGKTKQRKRQTLEYDDDDEVNIENRSSFKRQSTISNNDRYSIKSSRTTIIDDEEF